VNKQRKISQTGCPRKESETPQGFLVRSQCNACVTLQHGRGAREVGGTK